MWKVHDLSRLTGVSARTLHHYDAIGLLTPSRREENGYRLYSEHDLARLQQIVALKFLGFPLKQITGLLKTKGSLQEQLELQSVMLTKKMEGLHAMKRGVSDILQKAQAGQTLNLKHTLKLIEVYRMNAKTGKAWLDEVMDNHLSSQKIMSEQVLSGLANEQVAQKVIELAPQLADLIERGTPLVGTDPTTSEAGELAEEWFARVMEVFGEQIEMMSVLQQRWMLDEAPVLPCTKEFAEWMIVARFCKQIKYSWIGKTFEKETFIRFADQASKVSVATMLARQKAQGVLIEEVKQHIDEEPTSEEAMSIAQRWGALNDEIYGEYPDVKKAMQDAYWNGSMPNAPYTREEAEWLRDAMKAAGFE